MTWGLITLGWVITGLNAGQLTEVWRLLEAHGFNQTSYALEQAWDERVPNGGDTACGVLLSERNTSKRLALYLYHGEILSAQQQEKLGLPKRTWENVARDTAAEAWLLSGSATKGSLAPPLMKGIVPATVFISPPDLSKAIPAAEEAAPPQEKGVHRTGVFVDIEEPIVWQGRDVSHGEWQALSTGDKIWFGVLVTAGAVGLRVQFTQVNIPDGVTLWMYDLNRPDEAWEIPAPRLEDEGVVWTPTCFSNQVALVWRAAANVSWDGFSARCERVAYMYDFPYTHLQEKAAGACNLDVSCYPSWGSVAAGVCGLGVIGMTGSLFCTGTLITDTDPCTQVPYVLTANHCVSGPTGSRGANFLEFYWFYQTPTCNGTPPNILSVPRTTGGADFLVGQGGNPISGGGTDVTLLRMRSAPPNGTNLVGWASTPISTGTPIVCVHHPHGDYKRISFGNKSAQSPVLSPQYFHQVTWSGGTTEPGSSGSPLLIDSTQQIIGQLWGGDASCSTPTSPDYYGRFDVSYALLAPYLNPPPLEFQFQNTSPLVNEGDGAVTLTVVIDRPAGPGGLTVQYQTVALSATTGQDFVSTNGSLLFPAGTSTQSISVPILNDTHAEATETFRVKLTAPSCGAVSLVNGEALVAILDDDPDTDGDGISDYDETHGVFGYVTDPNVGDTDGDGLSDGEEIHCTFGYCTDPTARDTDGDGIQDYQEIVLGLNPLDPNDYTLMQTLTLPWFRP